jgi:hypothetical protein
MSDQQDSGNDNLFSSFFTIPSGILYDRLNFDFGFTGPLEQMTNIIHPTINRNYNSYQRPSFLSPNRNIEREFLERNKNNISSERYKDIETIKDKGLECPICLNVINGTVAVTTCIHKFLSLIHI